MRNLAPFTRNPIVNAVYAQEFEGAWVRTLRVIYFDASKAKSVRFPNLKKTTKSISIRLPVDMIEALKVKANSIDVPYQSLIKMLLQEGL